MPQTFGGLLKQLRKRGGMTQDDLAIATGYSRSMIGALERNDRLPDIKLVVQRYLPALGLQDEPQLAAQLVELAALARGERPPSSLIFTNKRRIEVSTEEEEFPHLPIPPTELVGRDRMLNQLCTRILGHQSRLLTLVGPPGVGKTRLALALGAELQGGYKDGVFFVSLAAIIDPAQVASSLLAALNVPDSSSKPPRAHLIAHLRRKDLLLILDNFEQLISPVVSDNGSRGGPGVALVAELVAECPGLHIVTTSRERLHLRAEQRFSVPPLDLEPAVELFVQRAQAVDADFQHTPDNQVKLEAICQQLDCLPLAIELCAAQIDLLSPSQLLAQLQAHRLDLLAEGFYDLPPRQRTLRTAIEHSYALLNEAEQVLLRSLGVFVGGFTYEAADAIVAGRLVGSVPATLYALMGKSLVHVQTTPAGQSRFWLLETIGEFALEQLKSNDELPCVQQHHAEYYLALAKNVELHFGDGEEKICYDQLEFEHDNLRSALRWSIASSPATALSIAGSLREFWYKRGYFTEGRAWLAEALSQNSTLPSLARGKALLGAGRLTLNQGNYAQATSFFNECLNLYQQLGEQQGIANALNFLGLVALYQNEPTCAKSFFEQGLELQRTIDDQGGIAGSLNNLGLVAMYQGDFRLARELFEEKLAMDRTRNNENGIEFTLVNLGYCELHYGAPSAAKEHFITGMKMALQSGDRETIAFCLEGLAEISGLFGETQESKQISTSLLGTADALRKRLGASLPPMDHTLYERTISENRTCLDDDGFTKAWGEGQTMTLDDAVALSIAGLPTA